MTYFARLDNNNIVQQVIVISVDDILDENGVESEDIGINFCRGLIGDADSIWKQSVNPKKLGSGIGTTSFRVRHACIGYTYNTDLDAFITPKPFESWLLDNNTADWIAPLEEPTLTQEQSNNGDFYEWDEDAYQEDNSTGWILTSGVGLGTT